MFLFNFRVFRDDCMLWKLEAVRFEIWIVKWTNLVCIWVCESVKVMSIKLWLVLACTGHQWIRKMGTRCRLHSNGPRAWDVIASSSEAKLPANPARGRSATNWPIQHASATSCFHQRITDLNFISQLADMSKTKCVAEIYLCYSPILLYYHSANCKNTTGNSQERFNFSPHLSVHYRYSIKHTLKHRNVAFKYDLDGA